MDAARRAPANRASAADERVRLLDICEASGVAKSTAEAYVSELARRLHEIKPDLATPKLLSELRGPV